MCSGGDAASVRARGERGTGDPRLCFFLESCAAVSRAAVRRGELERASFE